MIPIEKSLCFINMDGVGCGDKLTAIAAKNFPSFWNFLEQANNRFIHRKISPTYFSNIARPRLDAARFMWRDIPTISFSAYGAPSYYHVTKDNIDTITPEILEDLSQLLFVGVIDIANQEKIDFRQKEEQ